MRCNGCWCELEPKAKCIATACGHLYCESISTATGFAWVAAQSSAVALPCTLGTLPRAAQACGFTGTAVPVQVSNVLKALWSQKTLLVPSARMSSPKSG